MRRDDTADGSFTRRTVLGSVATTVAGPAVAGVAGGNQQRGFVVEQGEACEPIEPLSYEGATVEEFYGYTTDPEEGLPWSGNFPVGLTVSNASQLFLYEGPEGLSLVVLHDAPEDGTEGTGGAASMAFRGLPGDGEWVVKDDPSDESAEQWEGGEDVRRVHWAWHANYTDGGAFRDLGGEFQVVVQAAFDGNAALEPLSPGETTDWYAVTGDPADPERIELDMEQPVRLRTGSCD